MVKEKRGGRGGQGEDAWSIKYDNHICTQLRIIKLPVNPSIILFKKSIWGVRSPSKASSLIKLKSKAHGICMQAYESPNHFVKKKTLHRLSPQKSHRKTPLQQRFDSK